MGKRRITGISLAILLICLLFGFAPEVNAQVNGEQYFITQTYKPDTTKIPFRGDTLFIYDQWTSYLTVDGRLLLVNLDYFGLPYYDILKKHEIKFDDYLQKQIDRIFENERWIKKSKNDLDSLKDLGTNSK